MKLVIQRVKHCSVSVDSKVISKIDKGILVLLGIAEDDNQTKIDWLINKLLNLRIFDDSDGKMNLSVKDIQGDIMVVSNFTLYGDLKKGFRPSYTSAAKPDLAVNIYNDFMKSLRSNTELKIEEGKFQANMDLEILNDGPVTLIVEK